MRALPHTLDMRRFMPGLAAASIAALVLTACDSPTEEEAASPEATEGEEASPSNEPSAENPTSADDVDISADVALRAVNTALNEREGKAVGFTKDTGDEVGMEVDMLSDGEDLITVVTNQEGTSEVEAREGDAAEEDLQSSAEAAEVPLLRAMEIARSESAGLILGASLEPREGDLVVWVLTVEGPATESTVVVDAGNGAVVPEGDNPVEDNNIGAHPDTVDEEEGEDGE